MNNKEYRHIIHTDTQHTCPSATGTYSMPIQKENRRNRALELASGDSMCHSWWKRKQKKEPQKPDQYKSQEDIQACNSNLEIEVHRGVTKV